MKLCPLDPWLSKICSDHTGVRNFTSEFSGTADPEVVRRFQLQALRRVFSSAYRESAFYKKHLSSLPEDRLEQIKAGEWPPDLAAINEAPFTWAADISLNWRKFLCVGLDDVARMVSLQTSGTTGTPKRLAFSRDDLERTRDFFAVGISVLARQGDTVLILLPGADRPEGVTSLLIDALERIGAKGVAGDSRAVPGVFLAELERHRPQCVVAAPSQLRRLLGENIENAMPQGHTAAQLSGESQSIFDMVTCAAARNIRAVLVSSEPLAPELGERLRDNWQCLVIDHYGLTESGYGGGVECLAHSGYHLRETDLYFEVVDPVSGQVLPDGEPGEVVFTTLTREAMPLLRYRTGDFAAILPGPCACGSRMRRLGSIQGRIERGYQPGAACNPVDNPLDDPAPGPRFQIFENTARRKSVKIVRPEKGSCYARTVASDL